VFALITGGMAIGQSVCKRSCGPEEWILFSNLLHFLGRLCSIITLAILFKRLNESWRITETNIKTLEGLQPFYTASSLCGDALTVLDWPRAWNLMQSATRTIVKSYWLTLATLIYFCLEPFFVCCAIYGCRQIAKLDEQKLNERRDRDRALIFDSCQRMEAGA
jgi:hypothetical protein